MRICNLALTALFVLGGCATTAYNTHGDDLREPRFPPHFNVPDDPPKEEPLPATPSLEGSVLQGIDQRPAMDLLVTCVGLTVKSPPKDPMQDVGCAHLIAMTVAQCIEEERKFLETGEPLGHQLEQVCSHTLIMQAKADLARSQQTTK